MAAAAAVGGNGDDGDDKARDVSNQPKDLGRNTCGGGVLPTPLRVTVSGDPVGTPDGDDHHGDTTECSSSFGPSCSASDDDAEPDMHGMEVDSPFLGTNHMNVDHANSAPSMARHKKVTAEWKKVVGPIMWRCQWLELRMKNIFSQIAKYDKELAVINHEKDLKLEMVKADGPESELAKLDSESHEKIIMKRRKRKRDEEATDTSLYMKMHPALSYYENRTDGLLVNDVFDSPVDEDIKSNSHDVGLLEDDKIFEQYSLREILLTVDEVQSRILSLQGCLNNARSKYEKLSLCLDHRKVKVSQKNQKVQNHITSCKKDRRRSHQKTKTKALDSFFQNDDLDKPSDGMMGYMKMHDAQEDATQLDANTITFDMLFNADNLLTDAHVGEFIKESADDVLIDNQAAKEDGYQPFETVKHADEKHSEILMHPSEGEKASAHTVECEQVLETAPVVKQINSREKRGHKPNKKHRSSLLAKKIKTEKDPSNMNNERTVLVAVDPRRSQRVRKPKIY
ncbi:uncharacterized protein LOC102712636 [Oryza brachyantha]|uniref:Uncharacterized protein n=1 Tax=Oryza brachyantha TaxID=4533 RepID=J3M6D6_ORYBR|nr:uncharacterized protein LOC102712636 [Oryza brachyantha]